MAIVRYCLLAIALLAVFALPATATASNKRSPRAVAPTPAALATSIAKSYWGATPCGGKFQVRVRQSLPAGKARPVSAWASFSTPLGADNLAAAPSTYSNCTISLTRWRWPDAAAMRSDWDMLCMTFVHEYGHLLGRSHVAAPADVMAPVFADYSAEPALCKTKRPRSSR